MISQNIRNLTKYKTSELFCTISALPLCQFPLGSFLVYTAYSICRRRAWSHNKAITLSMRPALQYIPYHRNSFFGGFFFSRFAVCGPTIGDNYLRGLWRTYSPSFRLAAFAVRLYWHHRFGSLRSPAVIIHHRFGSPRSPITFTHRSPIQNINLRFGSFSFWFAFGCGWALYVLFAPVVSLIMRSDCFLRISLRCEKF